MSVKYLRIVINCFPSPVVIKKEKLNLWKIFHLEVSKKLKITLYVITGIGV